MILRDYFLKNHLFLALLVTSSRCFCCFSLLHNNRIPSSLLWIKIPLPTFSLALQISSSLFSAATVLLSPPAQPLDYASHSVVSVISSPQCTEGGEKLCRQNEGLLREGEGRKPRNIQTLILSFLFFSFFVLLHFKYFEDTYKAKFFPASLQNEANAIYIYPPS